MEKSVPRITDWHHNDCRVMTNGDREGLIFLFYPHTNNFTCSPLSPAFHIGKKTHLKCLKKILKTLRYDRVPSFQHYIIMMSRIYVQSACGGPAPVCFYLSNSLVRLCEINKFNLLQVREGVTNCFKQY